MVAHVLSVHSNQCISDSLPHSSSSLSIVFLTFLALFQSVFLNLGEEREIKGEREREKHEGKNEREKEIDR